MLLLWATILKFLQVTKLVFNIHCFILQNKNKLRLYLIDPNGEFNNLIEQNQNVEEIKKFLKVHMASWNIRKDSSRRKSSNETNNK